MCDCMKVKQEVSERSPEVSVCGVNVLADAQLCCRDSHFLQLSSFSSNCSIWTIKRRISASFSNFRLMRRQQHTRSNAQTFKNNIYIYHYSNLKTMTSISPPAFPSHSLQLQPVFTVAVMQDKHPRWSIARSSR